MLEVLIVEDEEKDLTRCAAFVGAIVPDSQIHKAPDAPAALKLLNENPIDVIFVDVKLPGIDGFQLVAQIREMEQYSLLNVVFVTGENEDILEIHRKYHHYDYINKPFSSETFRDRIGPLLRSLEKGKTYQNRRPDKAVFVAAKQASYIVRYNDILFVEIMGREITLHTRTETIPKIKNKLNGFIKYIDQSTFRQCHKSYAVNVGNIKAIRPSAPKLYEILFVDSEETCFLSNTYYNDIISSIKEIGKHG